MSLKTDIKIMKKPDPTDEEIRSHMNFDKLLQSYQQNSAATSRISKWVTFSGLSFVAVAIISTVAYVYLQNDSNVDPPIPIETKRIIDTVSRPNELKPITEKQKPESTQSAVTTAAPSRVNPNKKVETDSAAAKSKTTSKFTEATPVDGYPALYSYFDRELNYPGSPKDSIQGVVTVSFAINETGKPDHIKIENSLGAVFDAECVRLIENMPLWKPATINSKPVRTRLSIPLNFKIKK